MTEERFIQIMLEEGVNPEAARRLWETRPKEIEALLEEDRLRLAAKMTLYAYPEARAKS